jgi:hypothetical protein
MKQENVDLLFSIVLLFAIVGAVVAVWINHI